MIIMIKLSNMIFKLELFQRPALQPTKGREAAATRKREMMRFNQHQQVAFTKSTHYTAFDSGDMGVSINGSTTFMDGLYFYTGNTWKQTTKMDDLGILYPLFQETTI